MGSIIRLIVVFGKVAITVIVVLLVLYLTYLLINRGFRMFADHMGYETNDLVTWVKNKLPKKVKEESKG